MMLTSNYVYTVLLLIVSGTNTSYAHSIEYGNRTKAAASTEKSEETSPTEHRLLKSLLDTGYDKRQRPIQVANQTLNVNLNLNVNNLVDLDEKSNVLTTLTWLSLMWYDYRLEWNPDDHGGLHFFTMDIKDVWVPRIILQNTAGDGLSDPAANGISRVTVIYDGTMLLDSPGIINSLCDVDITNFPFDRQECKFTFTTQNVPDDLVHLQVGKGAVGSTEAATWRLQPQLASLSYVVTVDVVPHMLINYSFVEFFLNMERLPEYYLYTVGLPSTFLTILAFFCFWLPPDCGEKLSFVVSLMLGMTVFQFVIADTLPETSGSKQPLLSAFLLINLVMVGVTLFLTVITVSIHSSRRKVKNQLVRRFIVDTLPSLLCVNTDAMGNIYDEKIVETEKAQNKVVPTPQEKENSTSVQLENRVSNNLQHEKQGNRISPIEKRKLRRSSSVSGAPLTDMMVIAEVLDRIFFIILLMTYFSSVLLLVNSYNLNITSREIVENSETAT